MFPSSSSCPGRAGRAWCVSRWRAPAGSSAARLCGFWQVSKPIRSSRCPGACCRPGDANLLHL